MDAINWSEGIPPLGWITLMTALYSVPGNQVSTREVDQLWDAMSPAERKAFTEDVTRAFKQLAVAVRLFPIPGH